MESGKDKDLQLLSNGSWELVFGLDKHPDLCKVVDCCNPSPRTISGNSRAGVICSKHRMMRWRANNPLKTAYAVLKLRAKRRGTTLQLPWEEFRAWALETNYLDRKDQEK